MKNKHSFLFLLALSLLCFYQSFAQAPQAVPFQAVARNSSGNLLTARTVSLRFSIRDLTSTGTVVYRETQTATTDAFGLFTVKVGLGTVVTGTFSSINWGTGSKFLQVEIDAAGGTSYTDMGTQQMLSVPYALYAEKTGTASNTAVFGDGSAGVLNITASTDWTTSPPANLNMQYTDIIIASGATLTVPSGLTLMASGNVTINGSIVVAPGAINNVGQPHLGVSVGAPIFPTAGVGLNNRLAALPLIRTPLYGGGAGSRSANTTGSEGGGSFRILAKGNIQVGVSGSIVANGRNNINPQTAGAGILGAGGGGGGVVVLLAKGTLTMAGTVSANGGNGSNGFDGNGGTVEGGGGGGGGGIIIYAATSNSLTGISSVQGGAAGANAGSAATIGAGGGGGAAGGNGGTGGQVTSTVNISPSPGSTGLVIQLVSATPENFLN